MIIVVRNLTLFSGILLIFKVAQSLALNDETEADHSASLVLERQKELQSIVDDLNHVVAATRAAEEGAKSRRNSAEQALADYEKLKANELMNFKNYSRESAAKASFPLENILAVEDEIDEEDKKVFALKLLTSQLKKKLLEKENELAKAQIQFIALHTKTY